MQNIAQPQPVLDQLPNRRPKAACTLGIVGGGQLAKMITQSALQFGCEVVVLERNDHSPAATLARETVIGDWDNPESLLRLGSMVDVVTLENEFVDADSLAALEKFGHRLWPSSATIRLVQDKLLQKQALEKAGLPLPKFKAVSEKNEILEAAKEFGWPLVLKKRRNGYDGKGNFTLRATTDVDEAWRQLGGDSNGLYVEAFCPFTMELAIMITRSQTGEMANYPLVETVQHNHICHVVKAPAIVPAGIAARAVEIARKAVETVGGVGSIGVELFLGRDGQVLVNEMAPRVHNSGHYSIEGCVCSQFENHVRAVMGWPLGSTAMLAPAAVMVNLLGSGKGSGAPQGIDKALAIPGAHIHVYGKSVSVPGRKMGHVTALGKTMEEALGISRRAAELIEFGEVA
ncbi:5-(carboxyamino)imidazole ribonucleotide synthase [Pedosphaera parvula]|uniref:N5-carboxyaminoimidazole ribonucleotide synthase n=1 Tax=Pedosphaera parvula (strain Ellin514) TaxID=320771 RepID=B9XJ16_PEDPL|nr:5-(carboxyamino)imidazole ribonucleotide synthase [Pedosphaera parvula]EEF60243.1 phosphoribosylaminoimidazole carboxylase, ATPase subunit [Pedosphaera parvula Ellin514]